jgi:hypothetical protein
MTSCAQSRTDTPTKPTVLLNIQKATPVNSSTKQMFRRRTMSPNFIVCIGHVYSGLSQADQALTCTDKSVFGVALAYSQQCGSLRKNTNRPDGCQNSWPSELKSGKRFFQFPYRSSRSSAIGVFGPAQSWACGHGCWDAAYPAPALLSPGFCAWLRANPRCHPTRG